MTAVVNSNSVVPIPLRWSSTIKGAWAKVPRLLRIILVWPSCLAAVSIAIAGGGHTFATHWGRGDSQYLLANIYSKNPDFLRNVPPSLFSTPALRQKLVSDPLRQALVADLRVILGYFLVLITCAVIVTALAFSKSGKKLSHFILAAVFVSAAAHLLEDALIYWLLDNWDLDRLRAGQLGRLPDRFWIYAPAAMATVKWCALVVAIAAIPAAVFSVIRVIL
jgi:hypothetical protein